MRRLLIILMLVGMGSLAWAYDFSVAMQGYSLYYNVIDDEDDVVELTAPIESGSYRWTGFDTPRGILDIPAMVDHDGHHYKVVAVGERAFAGCTEITGLIMPATLTDIGAYAFSQCVGIRGRVTIGEEIVNVGRGAFYGCSGITEVQFNAVACESMGGSRSNTAFGNCRSLTKVSFGSGVRFIPDYAFVGMDMLAFDWNMPASLESVGEYAFAYCYSISGHLRLPESVRTVGPYAFAQCHSMTALTIPSRIERIDQRAFYRCINLRNVTVNAIVPPTAGADAFAGMHASAVMRVPCISVERFKEAAEWGRAGQIRAQEPCRLELVARTSDTVGGAVHGAGTYKVGSKATLTAICHAGYSFLGWSDGNTDNPREVVVDDTTSYTAIIKPVDVRYSVEYVHDTTYMDGIEVIYEYYEINDVAEPIGSQSEVVYDARKHRVEVPIERKEIESISLYDEAGRCLSTGKPRHGHVSMRRYPTGYYIIRVQTIDKEQALRFFHKK